MVYLAKGAEMLKAVLPGIPRDTLVPMEREALSSRHCRTQAHMVDTSSWPSYGGRQKEGVKRLEVLDELPTARTNVIQADIINETLSVAMGQWDL